MIKFIPIIIVCLYNLTLLGGTAYLVTVWNWDPYWFIVTIFSLGRTN